MHRWVLIHPPAQLFAHGTCVTILGLNVIVEVHKLGMYYSDAGVQIHVPILIMCFNVFHASTSLSELFKKETSKPSMLLGTIVTVA